MNNIDPFLILYTVSLFVMINGLIRFYNKKNGCFSALALIVSLIIGLLATWFAIDFYIVHRGSENMAYGVYVILFFPTALFFNLITVVSGNVPNPSIKRDALKRAPYVKR